MGGNQPMSREEFERARAMNGLARNGSPHPAGLGPGAIGGLPVPFGPVTAAALMAGRGPGGMLPLDPAAAVLQPGRLNGMLPGLNAAAGVLPAHLAEQLRRQQQQQQAGPLGDGWAAGGGGGIGVNGQGMARAGIMPLGALPRPPPGQPAGLRQRIPGPGSTLRAADGSAGPEPPANRHALHVWERDSQPGGLPPPPAGVHQQQQQRPVAPRAQPKLTPEELAKRKAELVGGLLPVACLFWRQSSRLERCDSICSRDMHMLVPSAMSIVRCRCRARSQTAIAQHCLEATSCQRRYILWINNDHS
jgi:hypothetical protein